jgi:DNA-binding IclR family transcriptional regulator
METTGVKVLDKALFILSQFFNRDELSLKDLEQLTQLNRSTIYRILQVFLKWGFLEQEPASKKYKVSIKILEMSGSVLRKISFLNICRPYLLSLRDSTGESSFLAILDGHNIVVVDWEPSHYNVQINITIGKTIPSYCTGSGKAILAFLPPEERESILLKMKLKKYTDNTITDIDAFRKLLKETALKGYGVSVGEYDAHIVIVSSPIFDIHNRAIASCSIAALETRVKGRGQIENYGRLVIKAASEISQKLGSSMDKYLNHTVNF